MHGILESMMDRLRLVEGAWQIEARSESIDVQVRAGEERITRCLLKLYVTEEGKLGAFFFKRSLLPYSRNRYSYGHVVCIPDDADLDRWLAYLASGLHPDMRPPRLRRAATDTVPD